MAIDALIEQDPLHHRPSKSDLRARRRRAQQLRAANAGVLDPYEIGLRAAAGEFDVASPSGEPIQLSPASRVIVSVETAGITTALRELSDAEIESIRRIRGGQVATAPSILVTGGTIGLGIMLLCVPLLLLSVNFALAPFFFGLAVVLASNLMSFEEGELGVGQPFASAVGTIVCLVLAAIALAAGIFL